MIRLTFDFDEERFGKFNAPEYASPEDCRLMREQDISFARVAYEPSKQDDREVTTTELSDRDLVLFFLDPDTDVHAPEHMKLVGIAREDGRAIAPYIITQAIRDSKG